MSPKYNSVSRVFLISALACAIFVPGIETQASTRHEGGGRLIVQRAANFGTNLVVQLWIDGENVADIPRAQHYEDFVLAGRHMLTIQALPNIEARRPTSMHLTVQSGRTYIFTAVWDSYRGTVLRRSTTATDTTRVPSIKALTR
jgi:hypothetical protein